MIDEHISRIIELANKLEKYSMRVTDRFKIASELKNEAIKLHLELMGPDIEIPAIIRK